MRPLALITGGTSGIGLATALRFAQARFDIAVWGRSPQRLAEVAESIRQAGASECHTLVADFHFPWRVAATARDFLTSGRRVDVLVNAAAVAPLSPFERLSTEMFDEVLNVNLRAVFFLTQAVWPVMRSQGGGVIVNISSLAAVAPFTGFSAYGASKAWLDTLTIALADEGREIGIRAYSIRPGAVETPMLRRLFPDFPTAQTVSPEEVAALIVELTQPPWKYNSGEAIPISRQT